MTISPDILWRNAATGDNYVWYLDGVTVLSGGSMPTVADQNWKVAGLRISTMMVSRTSSGATRRRETTMSGTWME